MDSLEAYISRFVELREQETETLWEQAALAHEMTGVFGRKTASIVASEVGLSAAYVRQLISLASAFPDETVRAQDLSFTHHRLAAMTEDPAGWIEQAVANEWSVKDMRQAIKDAKDRIDEAEQARRAGERLEQAVRKFNEHFGDLAGRRAVLSWETMPVPQRKRLTPGEETALLLAGVSPGEDPAKESVMIADAIQMVEEVIGDD